MTENRKEQCTRLAKLYRTALIDDVVPFWQRHSLDRECGGFFTCLDREGQVFDTDKFTWLQAREVWTFAHLYLHVEQRPEWLEVARHGADFLKAHGRDGEGNWHFSMNREGTPLTQPHSIFSDCFAAMAFCTFAEAADDDDAREIAKRTHANILRRKDNPKGIYSKAVPGTRPMKTLSIPMILSDVAHVMESILGKGEVERLQRECETEAFDVFLDPETGLLHESVGVDGERIDCFAGRVINPGHTLEAMWFFLQSAEARGDTALIARATEVILRALDFGWDPEHGGLFYYMDAQGKPPEKLEWDQKLWWVHIEALVAVLMAHRLTGREDLWQWFERLHEWAWARFPDPAHGEWFGYLNRQGEVILDLKGGKWKGCFHVPRGLLMCSNELARLAAQGNS